MHKFPKVASGEREKQIELTQHTFCWNNKSDEVELSNLLAEDKRMNKFTKVAN